MAVQVQDVASKNKSTRRLGADGKCFNISLLQVLIYVLCLISDFLPLFIYVLVHADFCKAEVEAEYMWGLVHPSLLNGEGGYYLTTLTSAVNVLKETQFGPEDNQEVKDVCSSIYSVIVCAYIVILYQATMFFTVFHNTHHT